MPDFATGKNDKPQGKKALQVKPGRERVIIEAASSKEPRGNSNQQERPATQLRRLMRDFHDSIKALKGLGKAGETSQPHARTGEAPAAQAVAAVQGARDSHTHSQTQVIKEVPVVVRQTDRRERSRSTEKSSSRSSDKVTNLTQRAAGVDRTIRVPSAITSVSAARAERLSRMQPGDIRRPAVVSGADKEAHAQLTKGFKASDPRSMPAPARLSQILRADELMTAGELPKQAQVQSWAKSIRSGRRRAVADVDPRHVERILHELVGGSEKAATLLNTPQVAAMTQQHSAAMGIARARLESTRSGTRATSERGNSRVERATSERSASGRSAHSASERTIKDLRKESAGRRAVSASRTAVSEKSDNVSRPLDMPVSPVGAPEMQGSSGSDTAPPSQLSDVSVSPAAPEAAGFGRSVAAAPAAEKERQPTGEHSTERSGRAQSERLSNPDTQRAELLGMLMTNDMAHMSQFTQSLEQSDVERPEGETEGGATPASQMMGGGKRSKSASSLSAGPVTTRSLGTISPAPSRQSLNGPKMQGNQSGGGGSKRIEGTLRIPGMNADAHLEAEIR